MKIFEVVGGVKQGGILVRKGRALSSPQQRERLAVGALVEELEVAGDRLRVAKITGAGPEEGWISFTAAGQALVVSRHASKDCLKQGQTMTPVHCRIAQHMIKKSLIRPYCQSKLRDMDQKCGGDYVKYEKLLRSFLLRVVYPPVVKHFGHEDPFDGAVAIFNGIAFNQPQSLEITTAWVEIENLMNNQPLMATARAALNKFRSGPSDENSTPHGNEDPDVDDDVEEQEVLDENGEVLGVVDGFRIRGGCKAVGCSMFVLSESASEEEEEEEDKKSEGDETSVSVHVSCSKVPEGSVSNIMHVELLARATVADFKAALSWGLPKNAHVLKRAAASGQATQPLRDAELVPRQVVVSELISQVTAPRVLTRTQAKEAQNALMTVFSQPAFQNKLDSIEAAASGHGARQNMLMKLLMTDVFPSVNRKFGLPEDEVQLVPSVLQHYCKTDVAMSQKWLMLESLLRRKSIVAIVEAHIQQLRSAPRGPNANCDAEDEDTRSDFKKVGPEQNRLHTQYYEIGSDCGGDSNDEWESDGEAHACATIMGA